MKKRLLIAVTLFVPIMNIRCSSRAAPIVADGPGGITTISGARTLASILRRQRIRLGP